MTRSRVVTICIVAVVLVLSLAAIAFERDSPGVSANAILRWGYYVNYDTASRDSLAAHANQLDIVSPYWYNLTPSGEIKSFSQPSLTEFLQASGVKVIPLIQNESEWGDFRKTIETPQKRAAIIDKLYSLVQANGYDGIQIDFEGVSETDRDLLTEFMTKLYHAFHPQGWIVSQAVVARTSDASSYWGGAYDYRRLANVNDYIVVMAYDYGYAGREDPIAVAPIWWVEDVADYASDTIARDKLILGVPLYGYDWNVTDGPPATSLAHATAMKLSTRPHASSGYDATDQAPYVRYKDDAGDDHVVWFENAASFEAKLRVMIDYRLAGFATWRLGHEDAAVWNVIDSLHTPATRLAPIDDSDDRIYFPETGHSLAYGFLEYWRANGGLARFGFPRTEEFTEYDPMVGQSYTVQYFERARFEFHPEYQGTEFEVLLGHIGRWALDQRADGALSTTPADPIPGMQYFPETGHNLGGAFRRYWESNGGLMAFGYPITEQFAERNPEDGRTYVVQYFERARFELHPEYAGTESEVLLGLLGNEMLRVRGWIR